MRFPKILIFLLLISHFSFAKNTKPLPAIHIKKTSQKIDVDGELNEIDWQNAEIASDFFMNLPADTSYAKSRTEVKIMYSNSAIYVGAICYDSIPGDYVIQSLKRDFSYPVSDAFTVVLDPFNDKTNGFSFGVNPFGVQREGQIGRAHV